MEADLLRPRNLECCVRLSNTSSLCSISTKPSSDKVLRLLCPIHRCRGSKTSCTRCNKGSSLLRGELLQPIVPGTQKRRVILSSNRPKPSKSLSWKLPFPDGKHFMPEVPHKPRWLRDISRPKGCLSLSSHTQEFSKILVFPVEKQVLCLPGPTIWAKYSSQSIYKVTQTCRCLPPETGHPNNRLPGRLPHSRILQKGVNSKHSLDSRNPAMAGPYYKLGQINTGTNSVPDILGFHDKLPHNVAESPRGENPKTKTDMPKGTRQSHCQLGKLQASLAPWSLLVQPFGRPLSTFATCKFSWSRHCMFHRKTTTQFCPWTAVPKQNSSGGLSM